MRDPNNDINKYKVQQNYCDSLLQRDQILQTDETPTENRKLGNITFLDENLTDLCNKSFEN